MKSPRLGLINMTNALEIADTLRALISPGLSH